MKRAMRTAVLLLLAAAPAAAAYRSVSGSRANVRSGPGEEHSVLWTAPRYTPLWVIGSEGDWLEFRDADGDEGWVHRRLTSTAPTVIVLGRYANMREGPGLEHEVAWVVYRRQTLRVLERDGDWLRVSDGDEAEGWIHRRLVWGARDARAEGAA